ncbi:MAG: hypothetical protein AAFT19_11685, partial [Pseudomonadota bacterium]
MTKRIGLWRRRSLVTATLVGMVMVGTVGPVLAEGQRTTDTQIASLEAEAEAVYARCMDKLRSDVPRDAVMSCFNVYDLVA